MPANTWSMHWIVDPRFRTAIGDYLRREGAHVDEYAARHRTPCALPGRASHGHDEAVILAVNKNITWLTPRGGSRGFRRCDQALDEPDGLLAAGGDLSPPRLLAAYRRGIFPWYSAGQPMLWWSPDPAGSVIAGGIPPFAQPR